jgi:hypothetical protein
VLLVANRRKLIEKVFFRVDVGVHGARGHAGGVGQVTSRQTVVAALTESDQGSFSWCLSLRSMA